MASVKKKVNTAGGSKVYPAIDRDMTILFNKDIIAMKRNESVIQIMYAAATITMRYDKTDICAAEYCRISEWAEVNS